MRTKLHSFASVPRFILFLLLANRPLTLSAAAPHIDFQPKDQTVILYQLAAFGVMASPDASGPLSYQWRKDRVAIAGATNDQIVIGHARFSDAGLWRITGRIRVCLGAPLIAVLILQPRSLRHFALSCVLVNMTLTGTAGQPSIDYQPRGARRLFFT